LHPWSPSLSPWQSQQMSCWNLAYAPTVLRTHGALSHGVRVRGRCAAETGPMLAGVRLALLMGYSRG
jgi:hypothetical protein